MVFVLGSCAMKRDWVKHFVWNNLFVWTHLSHEREVTDLVSYMCFRWRHPPKSHPWPEDPPQQEWSAWARGNGDDSVSSLEMENKSVNISLSWDGLWFSRVRGRVVPHYREKLVWMKDGQLPLLWGPAVPSFGGHWLVITPGFSYNHLLQAFDKSQYIC